VVSWGGRGTYGTVYRVERRGREREGPYALKLALRPGDERFRREAELLSRLNHPSVPRLEGRGVWQHPVGRFPYLVMQWVAGVPLYEWAAQRNPTSRQVLRLLSQVARALEATVKAGGLHRDVKGDNVLVRLADERGFLTDFGSGVYRCAATLTLQSLPPGTVSYRSPEAWAFQRLFAHHPNEHYRGNVCDDLFALGVTAYRLVTDEYPPPTEPGQEGADVWGRGGQVPRPPQELNANVCKELDALIMRLLGQPARRFKGDARLAADALEHAAETAGPEADKPLFQWDTSERSGWSQEEKWQVEMLGHRVRWRDRATAARAEQLDAEVRAREKEVSHSDDRRVQRVRLLWVVPGVVLLVLIIRAPDERQYPQFVEEPTVKRAEAQDAGTSGLPEEALASASVDPAMRTTWGGVTSGMPKGPLPGQRKPPCLPDEHVIRGGCWLAHPSMSPPCGNGYYEWGGGCYVPLFAQQRQPTSDPP